MVSFAQLFELAQKGFKAIGALNVAGADITPAVDALTDIFTKKKEDITPADMEQTHATLLSELDKFNVEMPD